MTRLNEATLALVEAGLHVASTPARRANLREAAAADGVDWEGIVDALEAHGVLALFAGQLRKAGVDFPSFCRERAGKRISAVETQIRRCRLTRDRFLSVAATRGVRPLLMKGASLDTDLYLEAPGRAAGDVDVLVRPREVAPALEAAASMGLFPAVQQFPTWWYRMAHFHMKVHPSERFLAELEIHWALQSPALLGGARVPELWSRSRKVAVGDNVAWTLDDTDRYLHLATHLASHWLHVPPVRWRPLLEALMTTRAPAIRLKWIVDLLAESERLADLVDPDDIAARAREWNAQDSLRTLLGILSNSPLPGGAGRQWMEKVADRLPGGKVTLTTVPAAVEGERPHGALDLRLAALAGIPRWIWPPLGEICRVYRTTSRPWARVVRCGRALAVGVRLCTVGLALPLALAGRLLLARGRGQQRLDPEGMLDLAVDWRRLEKETVQSQGG